MNKQDAIKKLREECREAIEHAKQKGTSVDEIEAMTRRVSDWAYAFEDIDEVSE